MIGIWLGFCWLSLIIGSVTLALGVISPNALPVAQVIFGAALCVASIVVGGLFFSLAHMRKLVHAEVLPAVDLVSQYVAELSLHVYQRGVADIPQSGLEDGLIDDSPDEILCTLDGRPCRIFRDGQVDLETLAGTRRFQSVEEARLFIGASGAVRIERLL